ncbi:MAG: MerC domain-containing protein [Pseudomonadota bacterium]|nr:MerC domain-containing protein [Pseudomonadota bacterium]
MNSQLRSDKLAISLSLACVAHCFFVPSFIILTSGLFVSAIDNGFVHNLILFFAVPISLFALALGYKNHGALLYFLIGFAGLIVLCSAVLVVDLYYGETGERLLTLFGSVLVVFAHYKNHQICKEINCSCHE